MARQSAVDQIITIKREGDRLSHLLIAQDRILLVQVDVLDGRASADVRLGARNRVDGVDVRHVERLGTDRVDVACLQLRDQRLLGSLKATHDDGVDGRLATEVVIARVEGHLDARIPRVERVGSSADGLAAVNAGQQVLELGRVLWIEVHQRIHPLGRIDEHVRQAVEIEGVNHWSLLVGLTGRLGLALAHHLEDDGVRVLGDHIRVLRLEIVTCRGAPQRVQRQLPAEHDVFSCKRRAIAELGVLPEMERRFQVLVRAIADHDRVAVVQGRYIDRQIRDRPHLVIDDHQLAVHQVVDDLRDVLITFARDERVWLLREAKDQRLAR